MFIDAGAHRGANTLVEAMYPYVVSTSPSMNALTKKQMEDMPISSINAMSRYTRDVTLMRETWELALPFLKEVSTRQVSILVVVDARSLGHLSTMSPTIFRNTKHRTVVHTPWPKGRITNYQVVRSFMKKSHATPANEKTRTTVQSYNNHIRPIEQMLQVNRLPDAIVFLTPNHHVQAIHEAHVMGIPVLAVANTDCIPVSYMDVLIPGNTTNLTSIILYLDRLRAAVGDSDLSSVLPSNGAISPHSVTVSKTKTKIVRKNAAKVHALRCDPCETDDDDEDRDEDRS